MSVYFALLLAGTLLGLLLTPCVRSASAAFGLLDAPGGRKVHVHSVPRLGGLAVVSAAALALALLMIVRPDRFSNLIRTASLDDVAPVVLGGLMVLAIGLVDDLWALPPWPKVMVQIGAAATVMASGVLIERITFGNQTWQLGILAFPVTLCWIVGLTNAFNLIDGVDGLAAGVAVIAGATCTVLLISRGRVAEAMLLAALVGAALGFLVYNFAPASIFLGDGGSLLFGFVLATTAISGWQKGATALAAGVPLLIFALPIADSASVLVRRLFRRTGEPVSAGRLVRQIVQPDREHIHHRLMALGWSVPRITLVLYGITLLLSSVALATARLE